MSKFLSKSTESAPAENLRRLLLLRVLSLLGQILAVVLVIYYVELLLPLVPLGVIFLTVLAWTLGSYFFLKSPARISDNMFFIQLVFDVVSLTAVLYFTGGATNPFAWFLLVPHSIASTLLPKLYAWIMALIISASYTGIVFFYKPLVHIDHPMEMGMGGHFHEHIIGMWLGFVLSAFLMAYFVAGMADSLRKRNSLLAKMNARMFRDERLVALGTLATGAAHELGTPLATMDIIAHELEQQFEEPEQRYVKDKLILIQKQIKRCKNSLANITEKALDQKHDTGQVIRAEQYIQNLIAQWQVSQPDVTLHVHWLGKQPQPSILSDLSLSHSMINILDNAAHASPNNVSLSIDWDNKFINIVIEDEGAGMTEQQLSELRANVQLSSGTGLGLGTYIAKAAVERVNGQITWQNKKAKGLLVSVHWPLYKGLG